MDRKLSLLLSDLAYLEIEDSKIKDKKYNHRIYPQGPNINEGEVVLLVDLIEKK